MCVTAGDRCHVSRLWGSLHRYPSVRVCARTDRGMSVSRNTGCYLLAIIIVRVNVFICVLPMLWIMHIICRVGIHCICSTTSWIGESCRGPNNITDFYFASCAFKQPRSLEDQYMLKPPSGQCLRTKSAHMYTCKLPDSSWLFSLIVCVLVTGVRSCSSLSFLVLTPQRWVSGISRQKRWSRVSAFQSFDTVGVFNTACIYVIWAIWVTLEIIALGNVLLFSGIERLVRWLF